MKTPKKKTAAGSPAASIDWPEINRVLDFMSEHGLDEFEFARGDVKIHLKRPGPGGGATAPVFAASAPASAAGAPPASSAAPALGAPATPARPSTEEELHTVKSPIVGTFYAAPNPGSPAFVKVGDRVKAGQVLCIVEAMKLMNEIESDTAGEVVRVLVENGQPVEYGQPLFAIRP
jgi:acetyl-CoA carboxylase biotin carboxyl carrier protein